MTDASVPALVDNATEMVRTPSRTLAVAGIVKQRVALWRHDHTVRTQRSAGRCVLELVLHVARDVSLLNPRDTQTELRATLAVLTSSKRSDRDCGLNLVFGGV